MSTRLRVILSASLGFAIGALWTRVRRGAIFGHTEEWRHFEQAHPSFCRALPDLDALVHKVFDIRPGANSNDRRLVYLLGWLCFEDFREILLLCGNGFGIGAGKLLRSLYEHAVTAQHLAKHPEHAALFDEYIHVQEKKIFHHAERAFTPDAFAELFTDERRKQVAEEAKRVSGQFKKHPTSWSPLSLREMAFQDGDGLQVFYPLCYVDPTAHLHATARGVYSRVSTDGVRFMAKSGPQREEASQNLNLAILVFLLSLRTQAAVFSLQIESEVVTLMPRILGDWAPFSRNRDQPVTVGDA